MHTFSVAKFGRFGAVLKKVCNPCALIFNWLAVFEILLNQMKRITKAEKIMIAMGNDNYTTYQCSEHGIYQKRKDVDDAKCVYCKKENLALENIAELKNQFKKELGI